MRKKILYNFTSFHKINNDVVCHIGPYQKSTIIRFCLRHFRFGGFCAHHNDTRTALDY